MFDLGNLFLALLSTLIPFFWIFKLKEYNAKVYFGAVVFFLFIYSGIGGGLQEIDRHYWYYYLIYSSVLSLGIFLAKGKNEVVGKEKTDVKLTAFIDKYGNSIISLYLILNLATLLYPEFLLHRIVKPPSPDLIEAFSQRFNKEDTIIYQAVLYYAIQLFQPFFYLSLFKYREKLIVFLLLLIAQPYIEYCRIGYIGRSGMVMFLFIYIATIYKWRPKLRKIIVVSILASIPTFAIFMINYADIRLGRDSSVNNTFIAIEHLFLSETSYPLWFSKIYDNAHGFNEFKSYILWLFTLPLPGFLKGSFALKGDEISELLHGISPNQTGFYILLPGIVGESVYYFGKNLFWLHGLLLGMVIGKVYNLLHRHNQFNILLMYAAFELSYMLNRGGTGSAYPFVFKHLLLFFIVMFIYSRYQIKYGTRKL